MAEYCPDWWPASTRLLVRRVLLDPEHVSADPRSRRRRTLHPDQRALPLPELAQAGAIYAYSFILTNLDVTAPDQAVAENIFRDSKLGAALRHLPSGYPRVNLTHHHPDQAGVRHEIGVIKGCVRLRGAMQQSH